MKTNAEEEDHKLETDYSTKETREDVETEESGADEDRELIVNFKH